MTRTYHLIAEWQGRSISLACGDRATVEALSQELVTLLAKYQIEEPDLLLDVVPGVPEGGDDNAT